MLNFIEQLFEPGSFDTLLLCKFQDLFNSFFPLAQGRTNLADGKDFDGFNLVHRNLGTDIKLADRLDRVVEKLYPKRVR